MRSPVVFISYSHDSKEHAQRVLALSDRLREDGVDCTVDQYEQSPPEGWHKWMDSQIRAADFVLIVCTERYCQKVNDRTKPSYGRGVKWESTLLYQHLYDDGSLNHRFIPLLFDGADEPHIPTPIKGSTYYLPLTEDGYLKLYRRLTDQPEITRPDLGKLKQLPPRPRKTDFFKLFHLPYSRNPYFTGREDLLKSLEQALKTDGQSVLSQSHVLSGLGGIGKTQTALEYAHRYRERYDAVLWVTADTEDSLMSGYSELARKLNLPQQNEQEQQLVIDAVKNWLATHDNWLLILDNADHPELLRNYLPTDRRGHILLTSRAQVFDVIGIANTQPVEKLPPDDARKFMLQRTNRRELTPDEETALTELLHQLGYLPLALEQAGAYMVRQHCSFANYLAGYRTRGLKLLEHAKTALKDHPESVATTWLLNFQEVEQLSPAAADLFRVGAFLHPDEIPLELFTAAADELGDTLRPALKDADNDPLILDELLAPLRQFSLITREPGADVFDIHRLVQAVHRSTMDVETQRRWAERTVRAMNALFPIPEFETWNRCETLLSHATECEQHITKYNIECEQAGNLLNKIADYYYDRACYHDAEPLYQRAIEILENAYNGIHPNLATSMENYALLLHKTGRKKEAAQLEKWAQAIRDELEKWNEGG